MKLDRWVERVRDLFAHVNRPPGDDWESRLAHHAPRAVLVLAGALLLPILFPRAPLPQFAGLEEGAVASEDVIAEVGFTIEKAPARLAAEREEAEQGVSPIFRLEPAAVDSSLRRVRRLFQGLNSVSGDPEPGAGRADPGSVRRVLEALGLAPSPDQTAFLADPDGRATLRAAVEEAFRTLLPRGVAPASDLAAVGAGRIIVRTGEGDRLVSRDSVLTAGRFYAMAAERAPEQLGTAGLQLYQTLLVRYMEPSLRLDQDATRMARRQARLAVDSTAGQVLEGERIVTAHERVTQRQMEKLRAYQEELLERGIATTGSRLRRWAGTTLYGLVLLGILAGVLFLYRNEIYGDLRGFTIVVGLSLLVLAAASVVEGVKQPVSLVPVAFAAILVGVLYDGLLAVVTVAVIAGLLAGQPPYHGAVPPFLALAGGAAAALGVRSVRRRADSWILIALITLGYGVSAGALALLGSLEGSEFLSVAAWGGVNATASTVFAVGAALPLLESFTGITTDQTLLELSDLNHPLLRRLSREAPGTYAHSVNTANLAEAACAAIDADALLARVGVYYHDIGKMKRPQFFIENQPKGRNPHDRIPPEKSAEVIRGHVSEGVRMAREARLPVVIRDVIREHHGTMTIAYFLDKARRENDDGEREEPLPTDYRYEGPRPQSKETAVIMLADGVESASRALSDPTPEHIHELIEEIVCHRRDSGQLAECPLTLADLDAIQEAFGRVLVGMYHHRVDYPEADAAAEAEGAAPDVSPAAERAGGGEGASRPGSTAERGGSRS